MRDLGRDLFDRLDRWKVRLEVDGTAHSYPLWGETRWIREAERRLGLEEWNHHRGFFTEPLRRTLAPVPWWMTP